MDESIKLIACFLDLDYCKIMEIMPDGRFILRAGTGWKSEFVGKNVVCGETESQAMYTLLLRMPVIVEDFEEENRFKKPEILKIHGVASGEYFNRQYRKMFWSTCCQIHEKKEVYTR